MRTEADSGQAWAPARPSTRNRAEFATDLLAAALRRPGAATRLRVRGDCMEPLLRDGDEVVVKGGALPESAVGSLLLCKGPGGLVCHRLVRGGAGAYEVRGDRSSVSELLPAEAVLGEVRAILRGGRWLPLHAPWWRWRSRVVALLADLSRRLSTVGFPEDVRRFGARPGRALARRLAGL